MGKKQENVVQELIAKKRQAYQDKKEAEERLPEIAIQVMREVFTNNDEAGKNSPLYITSDEAIELLARVGYSATKRSIQRIAKQLGRRTYVNK